MLGGAGSAVIGVVIPTIQPALLTRAGGAVRPRIEQGVMALPLPQSRAGNDG